MSRRFAVPLAYVLLFSFLAIGIGAAPVQATPITYEFTATPVDPSTFSSFTLQYVDVDGDGLLNQSEVVSGTFSGVQVLKAIFTPGVSGWANYPNLLAVPCYGSLMALGPGGETFGGYYWYFGGVTEGYMFCGTENGGFTYSETPVPVPPSVLLLGVGLMPLAWARRKKLLGK